MRRDGPSAATHDRLKPPTITHNPPRYSARESHIVLAAAPNCPDGCIFRSQQPSSGTPIQPPDTLLPREARESLGCMEGDESAQICAVDVWLGVVKKDNLPTGPPLSVVPASCSGARALRVAAQRTLALSASATSCPRHRRAFVSFSSCGTCDGDRVCATP